MYPRKCGDCSSIYTDRSNFSRHKRTNACFNKFVPNLAPANTIINNNTGQQNFDHSRNTYNVTINKPADADVKALGDMLDIEIAGMEKRLSQKDTEAIRLFKEIFSDAYITNKELLRSVIDYCQTSVDGILLAKESPDAYKDVLKEILEKVDKTNFSVKDNEQGEPSIDMKPREFLMCIAEALWKEYFLPPLKSTLLRNLIARPVRIDEMNENMCELRHLVLLDDDGVALSFEQFCRKFNLLSDKEVDINPLGMNMLSDDEYEARRKYELHLRKYAVWTKEDIDDFIIESMVRICTLICHVMDARLLDLPPMLSDYHIMKFVKSIIDPDRRNKLYVPPNTIKRLKKCIIDDSKHAYVRGWRIIYEALEKQNKVVEVFNREEMKRENFELTSSAFQEYKRNSRQRLQNSL